MDDYIILKSQWLQTINQINIRIELVDCSFYSNWILMMWIKSAMDRYPNISKGAVSGVLLCLSDAITQLAIQKKQFDVKRNMQFLLLGLAWLGPCIEIWYSNYLPKITTKYLSHMAKPKQIFYRLIIDTLVFAPVTYTGFYLFKDVLFRKDKSKINYQAEIKEKFIPTLVADWIIWAPVNLVNFWWVPIQWQGLYVGVFSFFFNVILSYISNLQLKYDKQIEEEEKESQAHGLGQVHHKQSRQQQLIHKMQPKKIEVIL